jgi:signal transduction histidine kinase
VQALHNYSRGDDDMPRDVNVARSVDDALDLLRHRLRHVRIEKAIDPELKVRGFAGQLDQVFMNLITNAAQALGGASPPGKSEAGLIRVEAEHVGHAVVVRVRDDGPGIPADVLPRIFDPFFTTKDVGEGSGLGLSIVHGIIERHGGKIQVASEPGHGTVFTLTFPVGALPVSGAASGRTSVAVPAATVGAGGTGSAVGAEAGRLASEDGGGAPQLERQS